jgi:hypothetical protein
MSVPNALLLGLVLLAQPKQEPSPSLLTSHIGMEIDDLDFEIRRQQAAIQVARSRLAITQRSLQRGTASRGEVEQVTADVRSLEIRETEAVAFRALKVYQRDVLNGSTKEDPEKAYNLVLDLLKRQEEMAQVEVDFQSYRLNQEEALLVRGATARPKRDNAKLDYDTARLNVALSRARQAQLAVEHASAADKAGDPSQVQRLKLAYLQARLRYYEIALTIAKSRLDMAKEQFRLGRLTSSDVEFYQHAYEGADAVIADERKRLADPNSPLPTAFPRAG